jgi:predicted DNA-binding transcriptional regulator AlpA
MTMTDRLTALPLDIARNRILGSADAAAFLGMSVPTLRRLKRQGLVPAPLRVAHRKIGWRCGDLVDWLAAKASHEPPQSRS